MPQTTTPTTPYVHENSLGAACHEMYRIPQFSMNVNRFNDIDLQSCFHAFEYQGFKVFPAKKRGSRSLAHQLEKHHVLRTVEFSMCSAEPCDVGLIVTLALLPSTIAVLPMFSMPTFVLLPDRHGDSTFNVIQLQHSSKSLSSVSNPAM